MVTTMSAHSASSRVSSCGVRLERSMPCSSMTSSTSGCTCSAGAVPAERASWRPLAARSNSAWLICERPALWRQTHRRRTVTLTLCGCGLRSLELSAADELVGERAGGGADDRSGEVDPEVGPGAGDERGAE